MVVCECLLQKQRQVSEVDTTSRCLHFDTEFAFYKEVNWATGDKLLLLFTIRSEQTIFFFFFFFKAPNNIFHTNKNKFLKTVEKQQLTKTLPGDFVLSRF